MSRINRNMLRKRGAVLTLIVFILVVTTIFSLFEYLKIPPPSGSLDSIRVAYSPFESLALFWVAQEKSFFSQNAININVHRFNSGATALDGVINGEADVAVGTTEFPLVIRALDQESIQTIGGISKSNFIYLVGRVDRGIKDISDLRGKTIGTTYGTIAHYYLGRFLTLNGINMQEVTLVDLTTPVEWVNAVVNGTVDAVATAQPYSNSAKDALGNNAVLWSINNNQLQYAQAIATRAWINGHPELISRFLKSLHQAEEFTLNNPAEAKAIVKRQMSLTDDYVETVWDQNQFSLSLDQSLILAMESEARWLINNNLTNQNSIPDFLDYMYVEGLVSVKPGSVSIIR